VNTTSEEWRFFLVPGGAIDRVTEDRLATTARVMGLNVEQALAVYRTIRPQATSGDLLSTLITDLVLSHPGDPACRGARDERRVVSYGMSSRGAMSLAGNDPPQALADVMHRSWVAVATSGSPGWSPYDARERTVMRFDGAGRTVVTDPAAKERQLWESLR
jgi:para-nitrobenzyl esterase